MISLITDDVSWYPLYIALTPNSPSVMVLWALSNESYVMPLQFFLQYLYDEGDLSRLYVFQQDYMDHRSSWSRMKKTFNPMASLMTFIFNVFVLIRTIRSEMPNACRHGKKEILLTYETEIPMRILFAILLFAFSISLFNHFSILLLHT